MPEPRVNLYCGEWAITQNSASALAVRHISEFQHPSVAQSGGSKWKVEALSFEAKGRYRPDKAVMRSDVHPQRAVQRDGRSNVTLHGSSFTCFSRSWCDEKIWQIEYPADSSDMSRFFLKDNSWQHARYLTIEGGRIRLVDEKPDIPWMFKPAGTAWTPSEVAKFTSTLIAPPVAVPVLVLVGGAQVMIDTAVAMGAAMNTVAEATTAVEATNNYIDANIFCINKQPGRFEWFRPKFFRNA